MDLSEEFAQLSHICSKMVAIGREAERERLLPYFMSIFSAYRKALNNPEDHSLRLLLDTIERAKVHFKWPDAKEEERINSYAEAMIRADLRSRFEGETRHDLDGAGQPLKPGS